MRPANRRPFFTAIALGPLLFPATGLAQRPELAQPFRPAQAQLLPAAAELTSLFAHSPAAADPVVIPSTYWREGGLIGGSILGLATAAFAFQMCGYDRVCHNPGFWGLGGLAAGFLLGFGPGALIGGQFPKHSAERPPPNSRAPQSVRLPPSPLADSALACARRNLVLAGMPGAQDSTSHWLIATRRDIDRIDQVRVRITLDTLRGEAHADAWASTWDLRQTPGRGTLPRTIRDSPSDVAAGAAARVRQHCSDVAGTGPRAN
jgi:hypothetical protein